MDFHNPTAITHHPTSRGHPLASSSIQLRISALPIKVIKWSLKNTSDLDYHHYIVYEREESVSFNPRSTIEYYGILIGARVTKMISIQLHFPLAGLLLPITGSLSQIYAFVGPQMMSLWHRLKSIFFIVAALQCRQNNKSSHHPIVPWTPANMPLLIVWLNMSPNMGIPPSPPFRRRR